MEQEQFSITNDLDPGFKAPLLSSLRMWPDVGRDGKTTLTARLWQLGLFQHCGHIQNLWVGDILAQWLSHIWTLRFCTWSHGAPPPPHESQLCKERGIQLL